LSDSISNHYKDNFHKACVFHDYCYASPWVQSMKETMAEVQEFVKRGWGEGGQFYRNLFFRFVKILRDLNNYIQKCHCLVKKFKIFFIFPKKLARREPIPNIS
jgi:hypothetical protein